MTNRKGTKGQLTTYKTLYRKRKIEERTPEKTVMNSCAQEMLSVPVPVVGLVVLPLVISHQSLSMSL